MGKIYLNPTKKQKKKLNLIKMKGSTSYVEKDDKYYDEKTGKARMERKEKTNEKKEKPEVRKDKIILDKRGVETGVGQKSSEIKQTPPALSLKGIGNLIAGKDIKIGDKTIKTGAGEKKDLTYNIFPGIISGFPKSVPTTLATTLPAKLAQIGKKIDVDAIGKAAGLTSKQTAALAKQVGRERINVLARWAVNSKTTSLTTSLLTKTFSMTTNPAFIISAIGSYPFAGFIKEEALQTLSIPILQAISRGDLETAKKLTKEVDIMVAEQNNLLDVIPFVNIMKRLKEFFKAAGKANEAWKSIILTTEEKPSFTEERAAADEEARQRELAEMQWKAEYYNLIREGKFEEANELLQSQT